MLKTHFYKDQAREGDRCSLCKQIFREGERIRDYRSTVEPEGRLMCWNGEACAERAQQAVKDEKSHQGGW